MAKPKIEKRTAAIEAAINSITEQKDDLRKTFEILLSIPSCNGFITFQWKDVEGHISSIEKSIKERFREVKGSDNSLNLGNSPNGSPVLKVEKEQDEQEVQPRPELKVLCLNMDGKGLISFLTENRKDIVLIRRELGPALLSAPDPVTLALDSIDTFVQSKEATLGELQAIIRSCSSVMKCLKSLSLEITPEARDRALEVAVKWKEMVKNTKEDRTIMVLGFFNIIATFGLIESFEEGDILDLIVQVSWRREIVDVCRNSALGEKIPRTYTRVGPAGMQVEQPQQRGQASQQPIQPHGQPPRDQPIAELALDLPRDNIRVEEQGSMSVTEYQAEFVRLEKYATSCVSTEAERLSQFWDDLRHNILNFITVSGVHTMTDVINIALEIENNKMKISQLQDRQKKRGQFVVSNSSDNKPNGSKKLKTMKKTEEKKLLKCFSCGKTGHKRDQCRYKGKELVWCNYCQRTGHLETTCRTKTTICNICKKVGHYATGCPERGKMQSENRMLMPDSRARPESYHD